MAGKGPASDDDAIVLSGSCRCDKIGYTSTTLPTDIANCHCRACRRMSGGPYITWADFPTSSISWHSIATSGTGSKIPGDAAMAQYSSNDWAIRGFCGDCGSTLRLWYKCDPGKVSIAAGSFHEQSVKGVTLKAKKHIFLDEKASWEVLGDDGLQKHQGFSDKVLEKKVEEWTEERPEPTTEELCRPENA